MNYLAHISEDGREQTVYQHLQGTAIYCEKFAEEFGAGEQGRIAGLLHDIGKYSKEFQRRIIDNGPKVDHSTAGAWECTQNGRIEEAFCIAGHHGGLMDFGGQTDTADQATFCGRMKKVQAGKIPKYDQWNNEIKESINRGMNKRKSPIESDFFTRMLYSCLVDADFLDTEAFMSNNEVERGTGEGISALAEKLDKYVEGWFPPKTKLNIQRCNILKRCIDVGENREKSRGLFSLTVPTGGGKTVASLAFALHHAKTHGLKRVIYVIPYTSIIEQTADTFRSILGEDNVLEHHSGVLFDAEDEATPLTQRLAHATENWDMPVIVTTAVQFFESIYGNKSSKCRKNHNLANSVIIFDEAQMMPIPYLYPCVSAISQLVAHYGVSAVLCTATQPSLDNAFKKFLPERKIIELCPGNIYDLATFKRVMFRNVGRVSWQCLAEQMNDIPQCLCIVNTRKSAKELFELLDNEDGVYHLSTFMVSAHRRKILNEIRERLKAGKICRVVSTSLIEAGVDVDFPEVFRETAGLDSILQAAGRCNREGKRTAEESQVTIFQSEEQDPQLFKQQIDVGRSIIKEFGDKIDTPEAIKKYFFKLLIIKGEAALDQKQIISKMNEKRVFLFKTIAELFHMIDNNTITIYIPYDEGESLIEKLRQGEYSKTLFRKASQYSVDLYDKHFQKLKENGDIEPLAGIGNEQMWVLRDTTIYNEEDGLSLENDNGKALFI